MAIIASTQGHDGSLSPRCSSFYSEACSSEDVRVSDCGEQQAGKCFPHSGASWAETGSTEDVEAVAATSSDSDAPAVDSDAEQLPINVVAWGSVGTRITRAMLKCPEEDKHIDPAAWRVVGNRIFRSLMIASNDEGE
mmetsp:Transcript_38825/g.76986  ORF Transcript_38825/g.76986 Transcript_38825/m.76986 type:complete len:137 (+) Transcript_38825:56-466(+)|eukprot:CAMPEP_0172676112 /NCGR_PEP_ID=MMETSP1074-20121228/13729_1 /TAXON_ID=2916 /ORGANISM="Ceratium fusus, Strain PA161109" /LENGTH=136 /DNA_ID=CAMNT_0013493687 /DNA_START=6 /DNA_END=416 /DNA_ORIENTATION=+